MAVKCIQCSRAFLSLLKCFLLSWVVKGLILIVKGVKPVVAFVGLLLFLSAGWLSIFEVLSLLSLSNLD